MNLVDPCGHLVVVTKSDTDILPGVTSALYISSAGTLQVTDEFNNVVALPSMNAGWHPIRIKQIWSTNTTASGFIAAYQT